MEIQDRLRSVQKIAHEWYVETIWYVDITDYVVKLFGDDVVEKAEVTLYYDGDDIKEAIEETKRYIDRIDYEVNFVNAYARSIFVTFANGKQAEFWSSEWGGIRVITL